MLPKSLPEALDALDKEPLFRRELGDTFIDYFVTLKRTEAGRYQRSLEEARMRRTERRTERMGAERVFRFLLVKGRCERRLSSSVAGPIAGIASLRWPGRNKRSTS